MYSIIQIDNLIINNSSLSQPGLLCAILGKVSSTFLTANLLLINFLEFLTSSKIANKEVETEKHNIYMWKGILLLSWVASIFGINRYEQLELKFVYVIYQRLTFLL